MSAAHPALSAMATIAKKEALDVIRDRRAVFFAFVLPLLLYPVLYLALSRVLAPPAEDRILPVASSRLPVALADLLVGSKLDLKDTDADAAGSLHAGEVAAVIDFERGAGGAPSRARIRFLSAATDSREALRRILSAFQLWEGRVLEARFAERGIPERPSTVVVLDESDVSSGGERSLSRLGRMFPMFLVLLLLSGGAFVALDLVAGEKERGTLETLYVHPVPVRAVIWGKFLVLLAVSLASVVLNLAGLGISVGLGRLTGLEPPFLEGAVIAFPPLRDAIAIVLLVLPLAVTTSAVLLVVSAHSSSFREAQTYLLPVTLLALALLLLAVSPGARLGSVIAIVPLANVALGMREALEGTLSVGPFLLALASSCVWASLALARAAGLLWREDIVLGLRPPALGAVEDADARARRGFLFGIAMLVVLYFGASSLQARSPYLGLAITLWGLVLVPAVLYPRAVGVPARVLLGLRAAPLRDYVLAPILALACLVVVTAWMALQDSLLRIPAAAERAFAEVLRAQELGPVVALLLFAVSPAICEELLWRGAFQGELEPRRRPFRTVVLVGIFFGLFHQSIYRLLPTAILGGVLAAVRHRSGSIFPCMVLHATYNGVLFLAFTAGGREGLERIQDTALAVPVVMVAVVALGAGLALLGPASSRGAPGARAS